MSNSPKTKKSSRIKKQKTKYYILSIQNRPDGSVMVAALAKYDIFFKNVIFVGKPP